MSFKDVTTLGSVVKCFDSKRIPLSTREREMKQGRVPYYGAAGIIDYVNEPIFSGLYLLMGEDGSVSKDDGTPVLQLVSGEFWINNHAHVLQGETDIDTRYLYYALGKTNIQGFVTGAVQPKLNQANMNRIPVYYPEKSIRERIVDILGGLDDKIELNRKTNATLEAIAQAIFKEWFVNFNYPGATGEMVESELGPIPKGWSVTHLGDEGEFKNGVNYSRDESGDHTYSIVNVRNIVGNRYVLKADLDKIAFDAKKAASYKLSTQDIIIARSASPGEAAILFELSDDTIFSGFTIRYRVNVKEHLLYLFLLIQSIKEKLADLANGTTLKSINQASLRNVQIVLPDENTTKSFSVFIRPIFEEIFGNQLESKLLCSIRDFLLSKLMNP